MILKLWKETEPDGRYTWHCTCGPCGCLIALAFLAIIVYLIR